MSQIDERQRKIDSRIERLRKRVKEIPDPALRAALLGVLDLLGDEL